ncbi:MAG: flagellar filament capping protein FliD [Spirochaetaceae bacterium]|nr:MAG: flagellar filament capping protein FliD [Spirochaetaceae bacterium]
MPGPKTRLSAFFILSATLTLVPLQILAQSFSIPGVSSKYDSEETIEKLVEAESIPLARMERERETFKDQKSAWISLNQRMVSVRDSAQNLYSFQNPFNNKIASSSDESVLTATADRTSVEEEVSILVKRIATADRFLSKPMPKDYKVPAGLYRFRVGEEEVRFNFRGGTLRELAEAINAKSEGLLEASVISDSKNTQVFLIESKKTGARNQMTLHDQAAVFGEEAGIIERSLEASRTIQLSPSLVEGEEISVSEGTLRLKPVSEAKIPLRPPHTMKTNMVLSLEVRVQRLPEEPYEQPTAPPGPAIPSVGGIEFEGIGVESARSRTVLPPWEPPEPPQRVDDAKILFVQEGDRLIALPPLQDSDEFVPLQFEASELPARIDGLVVRNRNTHRIVEVRNIRIYDKTARGEYRALNPLSSAEDALIEMNGIEITRESNDIDDLLPGVNITLHGAGDLPVSLSVARDMESIKEGLYNFIGYYNRLLMHIDILTRQDEQVLESAIFLDDNEKQQAEQDLGLFQGNTTLMQLKSRLQRIMMDPHPTDGGRELSLLAQIGISTSGGGFQSSGVVDRTRLRGYLQIDEAKLEESVTRMGDWVKQLFGYDGDNDLTIDSGAAYQVDTYLRAFVETGGIVANRMATLDGSIARKEREIERFNEHLQDYEAELRRKFGAMEGALDNLEKSSRAIENLNRRNE